MKIKGQYEAQIKISFYENSELPIYELRRKLNRLDEEICVLLNHELIRSNNSTITVKKIYADVQEIKQ